MRGGAQCSHRFHRLGISPRTSAPPVAYKQLLGPLPWIMHEVLGRKLIMLLCVAYFILWLDSGGWMGAGDRVAAAR
jgi:hypothetical protein